MCAVDGASAIAGGRRPASRHHNIYGARYRARDSSENPLNRIVLDNLLLSPYIPQNAARQMKTASWTHGWTNTTQ